jgi:hypothetical protein
VGNPGKPDLADIWAVSQQHLDGIVDFTTTFAQERSSPDARSTNLEAKQDIDVRGDLSTDVRQDTRDAIPSSFPPRMPSRRGGVVPFPDGVDLADPASTRFVATASD